MTHTNLTIMLKIHLKRCLFILLFSLTFHYGKAQPMGRACSINLAIEVDTSIQILNWILYRQGFLNKVDAEKVRLKFISRLSSSKRIPLIPIWDKNIISTTKDSVYADILLILIKDKDSMSVRINGLLLAKDEGKGCDLDYAIHNMPFIKGNFVISIKRPSSQCSYRGVYRETKFKLPCCNQDLWDITPTDWNAQKND